MKLRGYMIEVEFDGETLTAEGTNKASQVALRGEDRNKGPVVLPVAEIQRIEFKNANPITNGKVDVHSVDGSRYQIHFRRKDRDAFAELYSALEAATA